MKMMWMVFDDIEEHIDYSDEHFNPAKHLLEIFEQHEEDLSNAFAYNRGCKPSNVGNGGEGRAEQEGASIRCSNGILYMSQT